MGRERTLAMTDRTEKTDAPPKPKAPPQRRRPSYDRVIENLDKWINSSGLQKPT
jgi:hypothetical protein